MSNSILIFDLLGEELQGDHDNEVISLPGGCTLRIWEDCGKYRWCFEATTGTGTGLCGRQCSRELAFDRAISYLAEFIN